MKNFLLRLGITLSWFILINITVFFVMYILIILNIDEVEPLLIFYGIAIWGCVALPLSNASCFLFPGSGLVFLILISYLITLFFTRNFDETALRSKFRFAGKAILIFVIFCVLALLLLFGLNNLFFNV
jgi:hypothetical protein